MRTDQSSSGAPQRLVRSDHGSPRRLVVTVPAASVRPYVLTWIVCGTAEHTASRIHSGWTAKLLFMTRSFDRSTEAKLGWLIRSCMIVTKLG